MAKGHRSSDIDAQLRRAFREIESDPLPDDLLGLLERLREQDGAKGGASHGDPPDEE